MDPAAAEEARGTGQLKAGRRTVAGVVTQEVYDALVALRRERGIPTMSQAVGDVLQEWARAGPSAGREPHETLDPRRRASAAEPGFKPTAAREVTLQPWEEVRGVVRDIEQDGPRVRIVLQDGVDTVALNMPMGPRGPPVETGARVAILRTDGPREYVVRILD